MHKEKLVGGYQWCTEVSLAQILVTPSDFGFGYSVEVDLAYLPAIHDIHNDLPLAPKKSRIPTEWKSDYANSFGLNVGSKTEKLLETLLHSHHYVGHYENLKFHVHHGLNVTKLHRVVKFQQSKRLGAYTSKNTIMRKQASNDF